VSLGVSRLQDYVDESERQGNWILRGMGMVQESLDHSFSLPCCLRSIPFFSHTPTPIFRLSFLSLFCALSSPSSFLVLVFPPPSTTSVLATPILTHQEGCHRASTLRAAQHREREGA